MILVPDRVPTDVRLEALREGRSVQALHVGPYDAEGPLITRLHEHVEAQGLELTGRHHEVHLGDTRRTRPDRPRTTCASRPANARSGAGAHTLRRYCPPTSKNASVT